MSASIRHRLSSKASQVILWIGIIWGLGAAALIDGGKLGPFVVLPLLFAASWLVMLAHEIGHLIAGRAVGIKVLRFQVGPIAVFTSPRRISFFQPAHRRNVGGAVHFRSDNAASRLDWALVGIAGPLSNAIVVVFCGIVIATVFADAAIKPVFIFSAIFSSSHALANLMPYDGSDGSLVLFGPRRPLEPPPSLP